LKELRGLDETSIEFRRPYGWQIAKTSQIVETMVDTQAAMAICETDGVLDQDRGFFVHVSMQKVPPSEFESLFAP
jgi:hypothetical protein